MGLDMQGVQVMPDDLDGWERVAAAWEHERARVFEAFRPDVLTLTGAALAVFGNVLMLRRAA